MIRSNADKVAIPLVVLLMLRKLMSCEGSTEPAKWQDAGGERSWDVVEATAVASEQESKQATGDD